MLIPLLTIKLEMFSISVLLFIVYLRDQLTESPYDISLESCFADRENVSDALIIKELAKTLALATSEDGLSLIETAGGVCSPFPSESLQV